MKKAAFKSIQYGKSPFFTGPIFVVYRCFYISLETSIHGYLSSEMFRLLIVEELKPIHGDIKCFVK